MSLLLSLRKHSGSRLYKYIRELDEGTDYSWEVFWFLIDSDIVDALLVSSAEFWKIPLVMNFARCGISADEGLGIRFSLFRSSTIMF